ALRAITVVFATLVMVLIPGQILTRMILRPFSAREWWFSANTIAGNMTFVLLYPALWVWLQIYGKRPCWTLGFERKYALSRVCRGALIGGSMMTGTALISVAPGVTFGPGLAQKIG